mmetsp:Transcript_10265/g.32466  ORF Transcript_10265/g.32466 Transcript_10265/m.32466 type:complete len:259 (+) Transcript_10265:1153-1929(+)
MPASTQRSSARRERSRWECTWSSSRAFAGSPHAGTASPRSAPRTQSMTGLNLEVKSRSRTGCSQWSKATPSWNLARPTSPVLNAYAIDFTWSSLAPQAAAATAGVMGSKPAPPPAPAPAPSPAPAPAPAPPRPPSAKYRACCRAAAWMPAAVSGRATCRMRSVPVPAPAAVAAAGGGGGALGGAPDAAGGRASVTMILMRTCCVAGSQGKPWRCATDTTRSTAPGTASAARPPSRRRAWMRSPSWSAPCPCAAPLSPP